MNTWGISGPVFLVIYAVLLAGTLALALTRWPRSAPTWASERGGLDEYEVAMLTGGSSLAAMVGLLNLDKAQAVELADGMVRDLARANDFDADEMTAAKLAELGVRTDVTLKKPLPADADPVERAVYNAVEQADPRLPGTIVSTAARAPVLSEIRDGLVRRGLLPDPDEVSRFRATWSWFVPVLLLGLARLGYGLSRGRPVMYLLLLLIATVGAMAVIARWSPRAKAADSEPVLAPLRRHYLGADGTMRSRDGMALALVGTGSLWVTDRALALALGADGAAQSRWDRWTGAGGGAGIYYGGFGSCGGGGGCGGGGCGG